MNAQDNPKLYIISGTFFFLCVFSMFIFSASSSEAKFLQTFVIRYGGDYLRPEEVIILSKFDLISIKRCFFDDINNNTFSAIKKINPNAKIFLYQLAREVSNSSDDLTVEYLNNLGRWNNSRGHSMGSLNGNHPELFLIDPNSDRIRNNAYNDDYVMDIGSSTYQKYWLEATLTDLVGQPWTADGIFADVCTIARTTMTSMPVKYSSNETWSLAMNIFINTVVEGLHKKNQKVWCNRTGAKSDFGYAQYIVLDNTSHPPDIVFDEGAFAVKWGTGDVQFYNEEAWKRQVDIMAQIHKSKVTLQSHTDLDIGKNGIDNYGEEVNFWDVLWYAMCSYHIGKNVVDNNSYFGFSVSYSKPAWFDEYDHIDLGEAITDYHTTNYNGINIYWREFDKGYVYVNPTNNDILSISLSEKCKKLTHPNIRSDQNAIADTEWIELKSHRAAILLKSSSYHAIQPPNNLKVISLTR